MYRLDRMRKEYEQFTAAEGYAIGFHIGEDVYCAMLDKIPRRYTTIQKESKSNGGGYGLYIKVTDPKFKAELLRSAVKVGTLSDLVDTTGRTNADGKQVFYNKGVMFEKMVYDLNGQTFRGKDSVRFYQSGDITLDGKEIQIKYEWARICYDRTLQNLKRRA